MTERPSNNRPLSPVEQLANVYDNLADDVFDGHIEIGEETNQRAYRVAHAAVDEALSLSSGSDSVPPTTPLEFSVPKTNLRSESNRYMSWTHRREPGWFARKFGLHPITAGLLTGIALGSNIFVWGTLGLGAFIEIPVSILFGLLTWQMQKRLYGDDNLTALFKGVAASVLISLPIPLAPFVFVPAGIVGLYNSSERKGQTNDLAIHHKPSIMTTPGQGPVKTDETMPKDKSSRSGQNPPS
jgi:hypothetical protein